MTKALHAFHIKQQQLNEYFSIMAAVGILSGAAWRVAEDDGSFYISEAYYTLDHAIDYLLFQAQVVLKA